MEPEVHIIEKYYQESHNYFTITNIKVDREEKKVKHEIDLLSFTVLNKNSQFLNRTASPQCTLFFTQG